MNLAGWALYILSAAAALVMVGYLYGRRELPGRGRKVLGGLRWAALSILILLLFDPALSVSAISGRRAQVQVLLDGSLSMASPLESDDAVTRWDLAVEEARRAAGGGDVMVFGAAPRVVAADSLQDWRPDAARSHLAPALRAAAEGGASKVLVLTDGGIEDLAEVNRLLPLLGVALEVRTPGGAAAANRALSSVEAPDWAEAGKPLEVRVGVAASAGAGDSARVLLREGERVLAETMVELRQPGLEAIAVLKFTPEAAAEGSLAEGSLAEADLVRYDLALESGDAVPDDDQRSIYLRVAERPAGVALVSFRPDWELRFLQPVLEQASGLPVQGFMQVQAGRFIRLGDGGDAGRPVAEAEVRRTLERAALVVLHGLGEGAPAWARQFAGEARRSLVFPASDGGSSTPLEVGSPLPGEWYLTGEVPASPVAELLTAIRLDGLPPLTAVRPFELSAGAWAPLMVSRGRGGDPVPLVAGHERGGRRSVIALADGFWRWALRDGTSRQLYRRLWSALGGWLLEEDYLADAGPLRPLNRVVPRGTALRWVATASDESASEMTRTTSPGTDPDAAPASPAETGPPADSVQLRVSDEAGTVALEMRVGIAAGDTITTQSLAPGHYRYEVQRTGPSGAADASGDVVAGVFTVESYSPEYLHEPASIEEVAAAVAEGRPARRGPGRPLHTEPWPYLAFVLLISTEWIFRRRWGLR